MLQYTPYGTNLHISHDQIAETLPRLVAFSQRVAERHPYVEIEVWLYRYVRMPRGEVLDSFSLSGHTRRGGPTNAAEIAANIAARAVGSNFREGEYLRINIYWKRGENLKRWLNGKAAAGVRIPASLMNPINFPMYFWALRNGYDNPK